MSTHGGSFNITTILIGTLMSIIRELKVDFWKFIIGMIWKAYNDHNNCFKNIFVGNYGKINAELIFRKAAAHGKMELLILRTNRGLLGSCDGLWKRYIILWIPKSIDRNARIFLAFC